MRGAGVRGLAQAKAAGLDVMSRSSPMRGLAPKAVAMINPNRLDEGEEGAPRATSPRSGGITDRRRLAPRIAQERAVRRRQSEPEIIEPARLGEWARFADVARLKTLNRRLRHPGIEVMAARENIGLARSPTPRVWSRARSCRDRGSRWGPRINAAAGSASRTWA